MGPPDDSLVEARLTLEQHQEEERSDELIQTIAAAYDVDSTQLKIPSPEIRAPSGLSKASTEPAPLVEEDVKVSKMMAFQPGLVQPAHARTFHPLLQQSNKATSAPQLFPSRRGGRSGLVKPASSHNPFGEERAGATYGKAGLDGSGASVQTADR